MNNQEAEPIGRDANELLSMPLIAMSEGTEIGRVKDLVFDPEDHALLGVLVSPSSGMDAPMFVSKDRIEGIGDSAITVSGTDALQEVSTQPRAKGIIESGLHFRGVKVVTETGNSLGTIDKVLIDSFGDVAAYRASKGLLGFGAKTDVMPDEVISIGQDAVVVSASSEAAQATETGAPASDQPYTSTSPTGARAMPNTTDQPSLQDESSSDQGLRSNDPGGLPPTAPL